MDNALFTHVSTIRIVINYYFILCLIVSAQVYAEAKPELIIDGLEGNLQENVLAYLSLEKASCMTPKWKVELLFQKSPQQIHEALCALGYYHSRIEKKLTWKNSCWQVKYIIQKGVPILIDRVDIKLLGAGAKTDIFQEWLKKVTIKRGDILNHGRYNVLKKELVNVADSWGYFDHHFLQKQLLVDDVLNKATIRLKFNTGDRYFINTVKIDTQWFTPQFVSRFLKFSVGDAYSRYKLIESQQALNLGGYFSNIRINYKFKQAVDHYAPIQVKMDLFKRHVFSTGVGYDTDLGPRLTGRYKNRYVTDTGHQFNASLDIALRKSSLLFDYQIPLANPVKDRLSFVSGVIVENTNHVKNQSVQIGATLANQVYRDMIIAESLNFSFERYRNSNVDNFQTRLLLVPSISLSNIVVKKVGVFLQGYKYKMEVKGAHRAVLSGVSFIQARADLKLAYPFSWGAQVIARTAVAGTLVDIFEDLPSRYRYYAGGENSVRGYSYKGIGQSNSQGQVIGGQYLTVFSLEYEQKFLDKWSIALFADAGDAFTKKLDMKVGVGMGIRWYSMVGPVRIDLAVPSDNFNNVHVHFSLSAAL